MAVDRKEGGVGDLAYPLVSDLKREISSKYYVLTKDGVALRGLFIIDKEVKFDVDMLVCLCKTNLDRLSAEASAIEAYVSPITEWWQANSANHLLCYAERPMNSAPLWQPSRYSSISV